MHKHNWLIAVAIVMAGAAVASAQTTDLVIGRWCDQPVPNFRGADNTITIVIRGTDALALRLFRDGSSQEQALVEHSGGVFAVVDNPRGDRFRIVPNNGELQLIDNDGLIRIARRLENQPQQGDCI